MISFPESVWLAALGGFCIQLLSLVEVHKLPRNRRPDFKDFTYYIPFIINPFLGGLVGYAYFNDQAATTKMLAIHVGISAPLLLRTMMNVLPKK